MIRTYLQKPIPTSIILKKALLASGLLLILLVPQILNPEKINLITCFLKKTTGFSCLTCGLSRSIYAASHLHMQESFGFYLMGPIIYLTLTFLFLKFSYEAVTKKEILIKVDPIIAKITLIIFAGLWIGFWIIRFFKEL